MIYIEKEEMDITDDVFNINDIFIIFINAAEKYYMSLVVKNQGRKLDTITVRHRRHYIIDFSINLFEIITLSFVSNGICLCISFSLLLLLYDQGSFIYSLYTYAYIAYNILSYSHGYRSSSR